MYTVTINPCNDHCPNFGNYIPKPHLVLIQYSVIGYNWAIQNQILLTDGQ